MSMVCRIGGCDKRALEGSMLCDDHHSGPVFVPKDDTGYDPVNHPAHYGSGPDDPYEVIKVCEAWGLDKDAYLFNVVKYIARAGKKLTSEELDDLRKAAWYLQRKIDRLSTQKRVNPAVDPRSA